MSELRKRLRKIDAMRGKADALVIFSDDRNYFYFTNTDAQGIFYYDFEKPLVFAPLMEYGRAKRGWVRAKRMEKLSDFLAMCRGKRIAVNSEAISASLYARIKARKIDAARALSEARAIKTKYEIAAIRKACSISKSVYESALSEAAGAATEIELKALVDYAIAKHGAAPAFDTIVATGRNIAEPHHAADSTRLGRTVLIDYGVRYRGYVSDVTRTTGSKYESFAAEAMRAAVAMLHEGAKARDIDAAARKALGSHAKNFITSLGHGIGVAVHEAPAISSKSDDVIARNMVVTIEPGIYVPHGCRIENDYVISDAPELLTDF